MKVPVAYDMPDVTYDNGDVQKLPPSLSGDGTGVNLSQLEKDLILTLFSKAAYAEDDASTAYDSLENLWTTTTRTITYNLSHVTSSNTTESIESGQSYTTTLTASDDYTINSVVVTMGGEDITETVYSSGSVSIDSVTGNIVITATAVLPVQSITATYTQSGTVYDTDSLDSLKDDLVVTANYSGGTSETIPASAYTLSGSLTVGTSTITVTYAGLTDTFSVTVTSIRAIFGTFVNGHGVSKAAGGVGDVPTGGTYIASTSARAAFSTPIVNNGYVLTVTDSTKYNIAVYDITDNTPINCTYASAIERVYYTGGSKSISWKTSDSATTPYILVALKKMDNTAFTDAELANGAEAVFTFTSS